MLKEEYFKKALKSGAYKYRNWVISILTRIVDNPYDKDYTYKLVPKDGSMFFIDENGLLKEITDYVSDRALINPHEKIRVLPEDAINIERSMESTYGLLFANYFMLIYAFGSKIKYINKSFTVSTIEDIIGENFHDNPGDTYPPTDEEMAKADPDKFYVFERERLAEANNQLDHLNGILVTNVSKMSIVGSPNNKKIRDELISQHKGDINDPVLGAKIDKAIADEERRYIASDPDGTKHFYIKSKSYNNARKRMGGAYGYEAPFTSEQEGKLILPSLQEGLRKEDLPHLINGARAGSAFRANDTQIGGTRVKGAMQAFQNSVVIDGDCGTKLGFLRLVQASDKRILIGSYYTNDSGDAELISPDNFKSLLGKEILLRVPSRCASPPEKFCSVCSGTNLSRNKRSPAIATGNVGTTFLKGSLKKMHIAAADIAVYNLNTLMS